MSDHPADISLPMQQDLFGGEVPMATTSQSTAANEPVVATRQPGWYLIATKTAGPQMWHRLMSGQRATVVTVCGLVGRTVTESQRQITLCPTCLGVEALTLD